MRIGLAPVLGYLIVEEDFNVALGVFTLAGITDLVCCVITALKCAAFANFSFKSHQNHIKNSLVHLIFDNKLCNETG